MYLFPVQMSSTHHFIFIVLDMAMENMDTFTNGNLEMTPKALMEYDVLQAEKLDVQFAEMIDCQLDDYEIALDQLKRKREILSGVRSNEEEHETSYRLEVGLEKLVVSFPPHTPDSKSCVTSM